MAGQLQDTKAELKESREDGRQLQAELLALARHDGKVKMNADSRARVEAFRRAPELAARERSGEPVPSVWRDCLKSCPRCCCEQVSQTLAELDKISIIW